ncbi:MAG: hypothetical protein DUW69_000832 [Verrucomicrobia bacterium]|nr:MAG: hypothetical protein DUW69_000832 [Verrucomicrobiota bacterium]
MRARRDSARRFRRTAGNPAEIRPSVYQSGLAAHAGAAMKPSAALGQAGTTPEKIKVSAKIPGIGDANVQAITAKITLRATVV